MRANTEQLVDRIYEIIRDLLRNPGRRSREDLARKYGVTTRSVSNTLTAARRLFGVVITHEGEGYVLKEPGVLDPRSQGKYLRVRR